MSTSTTSTSPTTIEQLPSNIPHLETDGSNWAIFIVRFREVMQATRCWPFFEGTISMPTVKDPSKISKAEKKEIKAWEHNDLAACYLLSVTGSSCQARIDEYFTRRPAIGINRDNAHRECSHCGGVYHSPTQCSVIISQAFDYAPRVKATPIPIPPKPEEGAPTSSRYPERAIKPLPRRAREPRP